MRSAADRLDEPGDQRRLDLPDCHAQLAIGSALTERHSDALNGILGAPVGLSDGQARSLGRNGIRASSPPVT